MSDSLLVIGAGISAPYLDHLIASRLNQKMDVLICSSEEVKLQKDYEDMLESFCKTLPSPFTKC